MPRSAWVEIRDAAGELLVSIPAEIDGGTVSAELPTFPPHTIGSITFCADEGGTIDRDERELRELPTGPSVFIAEMV
jgi:hypothetical protein